MYQNLKFVIFGTLCKEMQQSKIKDGTLLASSWRIPPSAPGGFFSICSRCCSDTLGIWGHHSPLALAVPPYPHTGSSTVHPIKSCASTQLATGTSQTVTFLRQLLTTAVHARGSPQPAQSIPDLSLPASIQAQPSHPHQLCTFTLCRHRLLC